MFLTKEKYFKNPKDYSEIEDFLKSLKLKMPKRLDYTIGIYEEDKLVGTGSLSGNIIKGVGVLPEYREEGISPKIITKLLNKAIELNRSNIFIYTTPDLEFMFSDLGFKKIAETLPYAVLLEWGGGLRRYISRLEEIAKNKPLDVSCIVMNANPFTLGHRYLIEKAAKKNEWTYIILVEEDKSLFPFKTRIKLVKEGIKDLPNIEVISGGNYVISSFTFPSYFTEEEDLAITQASLDLDLFANHIGPALNISKRFIGEEPYSAVTSIYNKVMKSFLPKKDIDVVEVPRLEMNNNWISASRVRKAMKEGNIEKIKNIVPISTYNYLVSEEGRNLKSKN